MFSNFKNTKVTCESNPQIAITLERLFFNFSRAGNLCSVYKDACGGKKGRKTVHQSDVLRAAVVLTHATLEDSLRTISSYFLPLSEREIINNIALIGLNSSGRPEKFHLGELVQHKGKTIDLVIEESIAEYLNKMSFNNLADINNALKLFNVDKSKVEQIFPKLEKMIKRRHQIVHKGDRIDIKGKGMQYADTIRLTTVEGWIDNTFNFVLMLAIHSLGEEGGHLKISMA